jgi:hypothetical protein
MSDKRVQRLLYVITLVFVLVVLGTFIYARREEIATYHWQIAWPFIPIAFLIFSLDLLYVIWLWSRMMAQFGVKLPFRTHVAYYAQANLAKRLPGTLWYVAGRAQLYDQAGVPMRLTAMCSGIEFIVSTLSSAIVGVAFLVYGLSGFAASSQAGLLRSATIIAIPALCLALVLLPWIIRRLMRRADLAFSSVISIRALTRLTMLYLGVWVLGGLLLYAIVRIYAPLAPNTLSFLIGCWGASSLIASLVIFMPTSFGLKEISLGVLLTLIVPASIAVITVIVIRIAITLFEVLWSGVAVLLLPKYAQQAENPS